MPVERCICHQVSFEEIRRVAELKGFTTIEEIQANRISSTNCKLCIPYVKVVLKTGKTSFKPGIYQD